jgi:hypothetical protein
MANKPKRKFWVLLTLTLIPFTDFVGANWFYMRNAIVGGLKVALFLLLLLPFLSLFWIEGEDAWGIYIFDFYVLAGIIAWWIVDIVLVAVQKRL